MSKMENKFISWVYMNWKRSHTFHSQSLWQENKQFYVIQVDICSYLFLLTYFINSNFSIEMKRKNTSDFSPSTTSTMTRAYPFILLNLIKSNLIRFVHLRWIRINHARLLFVVDFDVILHMPGEMASRRFDASHCRVLFSSLQLLSHVSVFPTLLIRISIKCVYRV